MRILHVMGGATAGGIAAVVFNYMLNIDQQKFHFDFALTGNEPGMLGLLMIENGAVFYKLPMKSKGIKEYEKQLRELLKVEKFDIIHVHSGSTAYVTLRIAKKVGIKCRIAHAHSTIYGTTFKSRIRVLSGRILNYYYATKLIGCGSKAGDDIFGKWQMKTSKGIVLPNAIDVERFRYNEIIRKKIRMELGLEDEYIIGMVGRLSLQKNQTFALKVIQALHEKMENFCFILIGAGDIQNEIEEYCRINNMGNYVRLLGIRQDIEALYQCFDICVMPSLYEGFPVAAPEAMAAGLPILISDRVTSELDFGEYVKYLPLDINIWVNELMKKPMNNRRETGYIEVKKHGLDIKDTATVLRNIYENEIIKAKNL